MLDQADKTLLQSFGYGTIRNVMSVTCETVLWTLYAVLMVFAMRFLFERNVKTKEHWGLILVTLLMFAMSTTLWATDIANTVQPLKVILLNEDGGTLLQRQATILYDYVSPQVWAESTLFTFEFVLGDAVVVWRAYVLWKDNKKMIIFPCLLLLGSFSMAVFFLGCIGAYHFPSVDLEPMLCNNAQKSAFFLSIATNFFATSVIGYRAWSYRREIKDSFGPNRKSTLVERFAWLVVESGLVYFCIWMSELFAYFPIVVPQGPAWFAGGIFNRVGNQIVGLYPTIIIVLVNRKKTLWDSPDLSCDLKTQSALQFAPPFPSSRGHLANLGGSSGTIDDEALNTPEAKEGPASMA